MQNRKGLDDLSTDPYEEELMERDCTIRERLAALWELTFPRQGQTTTLWGALRFFWREWHGPIIASVLALAVMVAVLLLTYRLV